MNGRRRDSTLFDAEEATTVLRFPGGAWEADLTQNEDTAESTTSTFWAANHDTSNVRLNQLDAWVTENATGLLRVPVNDDTDTAVFGCAWQRLALQHPKKPQSPLNDYFPYHVIPDI